MVPFYSLIRSLSCLEVATVEVGVGAGLVPPSTFPVRSTVSACTLIIISVVSREPHSVGM